MFRMKCSDCGHWNGVSVNKVFIEQNAPKLKVKAYIPMYEPLEVSSVRSVVRLLLKLKK